MGNSSSSRAKAASKSTEAAVGGKVNHKKFGGAIGRKSRTPPTKKDRVIPTADPLSSPSSTEEEAVLVPRVGDDDVSYDTASDDEYDSDEESVDEEFDEYVAERLRILADAHALKEMARAYLHPEEPVVAPDPTACARCYFDRASAPEQESVEEAEDRATVLADAQALKEQAVWHAHPELPVATTDATATARCYFDRASAPEQESLEEAEYRAAVLADALALKEQAVMYAHSELPVVSSDPTACARCYFDRASAPHDAEQIISTSAYAVEKEEEESLEDHMQKLEALAPAASKVKTVPAAGPEAATSIHRSASEVHLFDLQDTA
eukprot:CAMPEP_0197733570 /NCGR_PEP_ID=MMETSP1434-20131217/43970_1 /TAXON_ID=265543 /ORGANISM="Minutocellus polymorphus, Strain CCMP3303" /LENGTH=323 /DNA_ID=CAMNT_0043320945 /DNA_START=54 /DNA_END=1025 /DNA_ORIENTATION=-